MICLLDISGVVFHSSHSINAYITLCCDLSRHCADVLKS